MNTIWLSGQSAPKSPKTFLSARESRLIDWSRSATAKKRQPALSRLTIAGLRIAAPALLFLPSYRLLIRASANPDCKTPTPPHPLAVVLQQLSDAFKTHTPTLPYFNNPFFWVASLISNRGDNRRRSCLLGRSVSRYQAKNDGGNDR